VTKQLTKNFSAAEMACRCGCGTGQMSPLFMEKLQAVRTAVGFSLTVTSGFRCPTHNAAVGGKPKSRHLVGMAADLAVTGSRAWLLVEAAMQQGLSVGVNAAFIHLDLRDGKPTLFTY